MEILPCPFCGRKVEELTPEGVTGLVVMFDGGYHVYCEGCDAEGPHLYGDETCTEEAAIEAWNRRPASTENA